MSQTITINEFEGPLALLLELVEGGKYPVSQINVADITRQYLARIEPLAGQTTELVSEFVVLGARLVYIKSQALLPGIEKGEDDSDLLRLNQELDEYRRMQVAAKLLGSRLQSPSWSRAIPQKLAAAELPAPNISLDSLTKAFTIAIARTRVPVGLGIIASHISIAEMTSRISTRLAQGRCTIADLICDCQDRIEIVTAFLSVLDLAKQGKILIRQSSQFGAVDVEAISV